MKKKNLIFNLMSAIALVGSVGFTACADDTSMADVNPGYNPETGEVPVNLVFNVSMANSPTTRMTANAVQASVPTNPFRGIDNAQMMSFKLGTTIGTGDEAVFSPTDGQTVATPIVADKVYNFGTILGQGKLDPTTSVTDESVTKSHRIVELSLPTETNTLMCWGKAIKDGSNNEQGKITWNVNKDLSQTSFSLCKIIERNAESADPTTPLAYEAAFLQYQTVIAGVLTEIVRSKVEVGTSITYGSETKSLPEDLDWSDFVNVVVDKIVEGKTYYKLEKRTTDPLTPTASMCALGEVLGNAFFTLNTIYPNELRSGSGGSIAHMMKDLMVLINSVCETEPVSLEEVACKKLAIIIKTNVEKYFDKENEYKWKSLGASGDYAGILATLISVLDYQKNLVNSSSNLNVFPTDFNLPLGSVILQFHIEDDKNSQNEVIGKKFFYAYKGMVETYAMGDGNDGFYPLNYVYPAELCYFGNSPIRVTNETKVANNYPDGAAQWNNEGEGTKWTTDWTKNGHVLSTTRSVAMQYNINYGTALLETTVRYGAQTLYDNNHAIQARNTGANEPDNTINVSTSDEHFVLTGVLVGGQEAEVGWNYIAKAASPGFGMMVYDKVESTISGNKVSYIQIPAASSSTGGNMSQKNYTLLWDNYQASLKNTKQRDVYVALEFKNNSKDFWGENNLIRNGGTFYIVGKLDPDKNATGDVPGDGATDAQLDAYYGAGIDWPGNQALPPYNEDGTTIKRRRVFMQDFKTTANFVIGSTSLQHALVAVPDLRSGQLSLGLSVDLDWQTGLTFDEIELGAQ